MGSACGEAVCTHKYMNEHSCNDYIKTKFRTLPDLFTLSRFVFFFCYFFLFGLLVFFFFVGIILKLCVMNKCLVRNVYKDNNYKSLKHRKPRNSLYN